MPRIYDENRDPFDFCKDCFPSQFEAEAKYDEECEYEADHPPYSDTNYRCEDCNKELSDSDD